MAQAVERILGKDEVGGSSPPISSMIKSPFSVYGGGGDFYFALTRLAKSNPEYAALQNDYEAQQKILAMFNKALEGLKNNNKSESSSTKYALKKYSQHQIDNWKNSKRIVVYKSQDQLQQFIDDARAHKNLSQKMYFGIINDETANFIFQKTNIDVHNYNAVLRADSILKIFDSHGNEIKETQRGQRAISDKDILLLPELFGEIDYAEYQGKYQGMQGSNDFINVKSHLYPSITIGLVVQNKQLDIRVQTMYATKKGSNAAAANTVNNQSLPLTPETDNGNASSNNTVPQSDTAVNNSDMQEKRKFSLKEPAEETKDLIAVHNITAANMHKALDLVGFDEIAYVVIPDNADDGLKSALTGNGIEYREYEAGNEQSRVDVLNSLDDVRFSRKEKLDEFDASDYNGITLSSKEYSRLYSEAMTWDAGKTNQILSRSLNGYRYYYSFDDEYNMTILSKEKSMNIHEVDKNAYKNANKYRKRNVSIRGNGRNNRGSIDASERASTLPRENAPNAEGQIRREGRGYRAGYDEDGDYDNLQKEKRYSLKEPEYSSEIFIENEELADAAESLQEMLRYVSAENNELRSAFDIITDSLCKKQSIKSVETHKSARLRVGAAISSPYD